MEDLVHDLPCAVDFEQGEQIGEPVTGPVVEFKPYGGNPVGKRPSYLDHEAGFRFRAADQDMAWGGFFQGLFEVFDFALG